MSAVGRDTGVNVHLAGAGGRAATVRTVGEELHAQGASSGNDLLVDLDVSGGVQLEDVVGHASGLVKLHLDADAAGPRRTSVVGRLDVDRLGRAVIQEGLDRPFADRRVVLAGNEGVGVAVLASGSRAAGNDVQIVSRIDKECAAVAHLDDAVDLDVLVAADLDETAVAGHLAAQRFNERAGVEEGHVLRDDDDRAAVAVRAGIGGDQTAGTKTYNTTVGCTDVNRAAVTLGAVGPNRAQDSDTVAAHLNGAADRARSIRSAALREDGVAAVSDEDYLAARADRHAAGADEAFLVDGQAVHTDTAAFAEQLAGVGGRTFGNLHLNGDVAGGVLGEVDGAARHKPDGAIAGVDGACVLDNGGDEKDLAAGRSGDFTQIPDGALAADPLEPVVVVQEVTVGEIQRRGNQAAHVDARALTDKNAARVDNKDIPIGCEHAHNGGGNISDDAVEGGGPGVGLHELDKLIPGDGEVVPLEDNFIGRGDCHVDPVTLNCGTTMGHVFATRQPHGHLRNYCKTQGCHEH